MERYVVISTFNDQRTTNTVCAALESREIPVMIEHVHVRGGSLLGVAFRVLVPLESSQAALKILAGLGITQWSEGTSADSTSESASAA
jgi:hypothetical protein